MIIKCDCKHECQDKIHGVGNRVMNQTTTPVGMPKKYRCSVCGKASGKEGQK